MFLNFCKTARFKLLGNTVKNFRAAGHRFESFQKPLGRTCLHIHSVIRTALHLASHKPSQEYGRHAKAWLEWVSDEKLVLLSMMADASDEALQLTRILDRENVDPASVRREVQAWIAKINALFGRGACVKSSCFGYTTVMLRLLQHPIVWNMGSTFYTIGADEGVPADVIQRCLSRMRSWVELLQRRCARDFQTSRCARRSDWLRVGGPGP